MFPPISTIISVMRLVKCLVNIVQHARGKPSSFRLYHFSKFLMESFQKNFPFSVNLIRNHTEISEDYSRMAKPWICLDIWLCRKRVRVGIEAEVCIYISVIRIIRYEIQLYIRSLFRGSSSDDQVTPSTENSTSDDLKESFREEMEQIHAKLDQLMENFVRTSQK